MKPIKSFDEFIKQGTVKKNVQAITILIVIDGRMPKMLLATL
jgi:hypothetical protein